ncbi:hypothetical protein DPMN_051494 [Dreissena polymorpha]|uniref:Uncharacterized protein n=2 Tax=Dreissena polymorpha TaxID=45954 RepID=A0A9D4CJW0_DREPO|nr:hypothetical protein DPMN_051494 [Dreissena polymorpha]
MMIVGHTKFAPDQHFGIWKNKWRHMDAEILQDVANSVEKSSRNGHNHPHIVDEDFDFHDWRLCLSKSFVPLKGLLKYHKFVFSSTEPGLVSCSELDNGEVIKVSLLIKGISFNDILQSQLPVTISGPGLTPERKWYLHDHIREFCRSQVAKDSTCPLPNVEKPGKATKKRKV